MEFREGGSGRAGPVPAVRTESDTSHKASGRPAPHKLRSSVEIPQTLHLKFGLSSEFSSYKN